MSSILGNAVVRREDPAFLTGAATYVDNMRIDGAAHLAYARATVGHARILAVHVDDARAVPGVLGVFTADDIADMGMAPHARAMFPDEMKKRFLATDAVRYIGEPVVAVVAQTRAAAADAVELVDIEYDFLDAVTSAEEAARDEVLLFPECGTNVVARIATDTRADFSGCDVVVTERIDNQRLTAAPIEPRSGAAWWTDDGRLVHYSACQGAHPTKTLLAQIYDLEPDRVRVVVPDVGGGFGAKSRTYPEEAMLGWYARAVGRPVRWVETRSENLMAMPHGRAQLQTATIGGTRDGRITAYQLDVIQDAGAYPATGAVLPGMTRQMAAGTYEIADIGFSSVCAVTNTATTTAYRGAGRPEAAVAIERMVDRFAAEIGMDPAEVRRRNLVPRFTEPYTTGIGTAYDVGDYPESLRLALEAVGYDQLRARQAAERDDHTRPLLGIGIGCYVEITAGVAAPEFGRVELQADGRMCVRTGATPFGQGHHTTWAMIVAERTGVAMDDVDVIVGDTDEVERGGLTVGSRSVQLAGSAIDEAAAKVVEAARAQAAALLEAAVDDIVLDTAAGVFHVAGTPAVTVTWAQIAAGAPQPIDEFSDFAADMPTFPSGTHVAVVEVDRDTGAVALRRIVAVDDAGRIINPLIAEGQVHGGIAQGVAQVLLEAMVYDDDGNLLTSNFMDYPVISAAELPSFETVHMETPTWVNPLGAKGIGESGTIGSIPAVYNAVLDALAPFGVRHLMTPLTPEKVWAAMQGAEA